MILVAVLMLFSFTIADVAKPFLAFIFSVELPSDGFIAPRYLKVFSILHNFGISLLITILFFFELISISCIPLL